MGGIGSAHEPLRDRREDPAATHRDDHDEEAEQEERRFHVDLAPEEAFAERGPDRERRGGADPADELGRPTLAWGERHPRDDHGAERDGRGQEHAEIDAHVAIERAHRVDGDRGGDGALRHAALGADAEDDDRHEDGEPEERRGERAHEVRGDSGILPPPKRSTAGKSPMGVAAPPRLHATSKRPIDQLT